MEERSKEHLRKSQNERKLKSRKKLKKEDEEKVKKAQNLLKSTNREKLRNKENGYVNEKKKSRELKRKSRDQLKDEDPEAHKEKQRKHNAHFRKDTCETDRLKKFQEAVMYGPMFLCVSCHGKMFRCSVKILTNRIVEEIDQRTNVSILYVM